MKKFYTRLLFLIPCLCLIYGEVQAQTIVINGNSYAVNTVESINVGKAAKYTRLHIPGFPLFVSVLEIDVTKPDIRVDAWSGKDYASKVEHPQDMSNRKSTENYKILAAINGDFFGSKPCGAEMVQGELSQKPTSQEFCPAGDGCSPQIAFDADNKPVMDVMRFFPFVKLTNGDTYDISALNGPRWENNLILYSAYSDSAKTWTNEWGTEYLVAPVDGAWNPDADGYIKCKVEKIRPIYPGTGSLNKMDIIPGKAVLSGHGLARTFLEKVSLGGELFINWGVAMEGHPGIKSITNTVGGNMLILNNKVPAPPGVEDREKYRHPRTSVGYTNDRTKVYFVLVDGRQTGVTIGVSTRELADIMSYVGAENAINLDGGGSSAMVINGTIKNTPSERRSVINGLLLAELPSSTGISEEMIEPDIQVYPNPADKIVSFQVNQAWNIENLQISIYDTTGKKVKNVCREKNVTPGTHTYTSEIKSFKAGTYVYEVSYDDKRTSGKLIVK